MSRKLCVTGALFCCLIILGVSGGFRISRADYVTVTASVNFDCSDLIDNDGDTLIDYPADPGCLGASDDSEADGDPVCADGFDNDGDTKIDYPTDPGCSVSGDNDETDPVIVPPPSLPSSGGGGGSVPSYILERIFRLTEPARTVIGRFMGEDRVRLGPSLVDLNDDQVVTLVDLSILLYYLNTSPVPEPGTEAARFDINNDGVIDIIDVSILLYYWTP